MLEYCSAEISELAKALIAVQRELLEMAPILSPEAITPRSTQSWRLAVMSSSHMVSG